MSVLNLLQYTEQRDELVKRVEHVLEVAYDVTGDSFYVTEDFDYDVRRDFSKLDVNLRDGQVTICKDYSVIISLPENVFSEGTDEEIQNEIELQEQKHDESLLRDQIDRTLVHIANLIEELKGTDAKDKLLSIILDPNYCDNAGFHNTRVQLVQSIMDAR